MPSDLDAFDAGIRSEGYPLVCGIDEAGRGPLAGPVVAAAVVLTPEAANIGLNDSKKLGGSARRALLPLIKELALGVGVGVVEPGEIDRLNILRASLLAMRRALSDVGLIPDICLIDGNHPIDIELAQRTLVKGDGRSAAIAAASIVAKEKRDRLMEDYSTLYPGYGFETHKGYPTAAHREAIARLGPSPIHRTTFKGVKEHVHPAPKPQELFTV